MSRNAIRTADAPRAIGPYSQGVQVGGWVFTAGQVGADPAEDTLREGIEAQTLRALQNVEAILTAAGCGWEHVVKTTAYLRDLADFAAFNSIYAQVVKEPLPARSTLQAARLPRDALVEVDAIAYKGDGPA